MNADLKKFKIEIYKYGAIVGLIMAIVSIPFLGLDIKYLYGLCLGIAISIANFEIMSFTYEKAIKPDGSSAIVFIGYILRLIIYGVAFYMAMNVSLVSGIGALLGFIALKIGIYYKHGFKAKFSKDRVVTEDIQRAYEEDDKKKKKKKWREPFTYKSDEEFFEEEKDDSEKEKRW